MKTLGIDIGTTTISLVVYDMHQGVLYASNEPNDTFMQGHGWERIQDPDRIYDKVLSALDRVLAEHRDIQGIGVTGQMHGILYVNQEGTPVSPLYTWQDGRGDLTCSEGKSWAEYLSELTGYSLASGYGLVTHFYNLRNQSVPEEAVTFCTIQDYVAMRLAGLRSPCIHPTDAASFGLWDCVHNSFDASALQKAEIAPEMLPALAEQPYLGTGTLGIPVYAALGDNQASFLGATAGREDVLLINMGTGGQVSVLTENYMQADALETRPFLDGTWLMVGASLCGGRSYALLEGFFRQVVKMVTGQDTGAYDAMSRLLEETAGLTNVPRTVTTFQGTRREPDRRASISGLSPENFTPAHLTWSVMEGMVRELYEMFEAYLKAGGKKPGAMIGSGNGLRKNPWLCHVFEEMFQCPLILSQNEEEAACGAALYAIRCLEKAKAE